MQASKLLGFESSLGMLLVSLIIYKLYTRISTSNYFRFFVKYIMCIAEILSFDKKRFIVLISL